MGNESAYQHYLKSPEGAEEAAGAAWKNFLAVFGSVYLPKITSGLLKLASGLDSLATWVDKNQGLVKGLGLRIRSASRRLGVAWHGAVVERGYARPWHSVYVRESWWDGWTRSTLERILKELVLHSKHLLLAGLLERF